MRVSVIIPAFNEERLLGDTLRAVKEGRGAFSKRDWETELIVCDNNSTDGTAELARGAGAVVVFEPLNQIARARNRGAMAASGDWLVFVDADSKPSRELFAEVAEQIESRECLAGGCTLGLLLTVAVHASVWFQPFLLRICPEPSAGRPLPLRSLDPTCRLRGWRIPPLWTRT